MLNEQTKVLSSFYFFFSVGTIYPLFMGTQHPSLGTLPLFEHPKQWPPPRQGVSIEITNSYPI